MATQRTRGSNRGRHNRPRLIRFNLEAFERKLRGALGAEIRREPGQPGGHSTDFSKGVGDVTVDYLFAELLSKYNPGGSHPHLKKTAEERFWQAEETCFWANLKFSQDQAVLDKRYPLLNKARQIITDLLGQEFPLEEFARNFGFGPGASTRLPKVKGDSVYKYSAQAEVTPNTLFLAVAAICHNPVWKQIYTNGVEGSVPVVWGNRVTTVPKNYKTDRTIAVEPCLNMYVQKGLGGVLRRKLKRVGVDLDDQTLNQEAAKDLSLATIDFSMASDTVASGLVNYLLPAAWVDMISHLRSELGVLPDGSLHRYSKVSSMGNGFTFELESLIFWGLARAVVPKEQHHLIRVYGDDVIVPREHAAAFITLSAEAGFTTNLKKTFVDGQFRESCGKHFHRGSDVTPFYIKEPVRTLPDLFLIHNQLWRWRNRVDGNLSRSQYDAVGKILKELRYLAPAQWRKPRLPNGYGDDAFIGSFAECAPNTHPGGWEYFSVEVLASGNEDVFLVPDPGCWVKTDLNLHKRKWVTPVTFVSDRKTSPSKVGRRRRRVLDVPWWAWG